MNKIQMVKAFEALDPFVPTHTKLLLGGGGAMVLAHGFPLATQDLDALFYQSQITEKDVWGAIQDIALNLSLPKDWLNPYFQIFLYTLPQDYESRLITVFTGKNLTVNALGIEDLLILKCFANREKDIGHARALIKKGANIDLIERHINDMLDKGMPKSMEAKDFLDDLLDE